MLCWVVVLHSGRRVHTIGANDDGGEIIVHCSMLAEDAIKSAISNYYTKNPKARQTDLGGTNAPIPKVEIERESVPAAAGAA